MQTDVDLVLTGHGEDSWRRGLAEGRHGRHPKRRGRLCDRGHRQAGGGQDGWGWVRNNAGEIDIIYDERVVAVVKSTEVATDTESLFCE